MAQFSEWRNSMDSDQLDDIDRRLLRRVLRRRDDTVEERVRPVPQLREEDRPLADDMALAFRLPPPADTAASVPRARPAPKA